jgi:heat shock protein HtpX
MGRKPNISHSLPPRHSLKIWAAFGVGVAAFSYLFTVALAAACVGGGIGIARYVFGNFGHAVDSHLNLQLMFLLLVAAATLLVMAGTLLWSLIPRAEPERAAPRALLTSSDHPRLFAEISRVAEELGEPLPAEVSLCLQLNASVEQKGGTLGFGGYRVLNLGLPLLTALTVTEFRAILAHEFAHYYGGDTRLSSLLRTSVVAMKRTLENADSHSALIESLPRSWVFIGAQLAYAGVTGVMKFYWHLLLSAVQAISRRQEYRADEIACAAAGSEALIEGLCRINAASPAWIEFYFVEAMPVLEFGYRLPIAAGFTQYIATASNTAIAADHLNEVMKKTEPDTLDSHPPLSLRIAAAKRFTATPRFSEADSSQAVTLLGETERLELDLCRQAWTKVAVDQLRVVPWERVLPEVYIPAWRDSLQRHSKALGTLSVGGLPLAVAHPGALADEIPNPKGCILDGAQRKEEARKVLGRALAIALLDNGWEIEADTDELIARRNGDVLKPHEIVDNMRLHRLSDDSWAEQCARYGIGGLRLGVTR